MSLKFIVSEKGKQDSVIYLLPIAVKSEPTINANFSSLCLFGRNKFKADKNSEINKTIEPN